MPNKKAFILAIGSLVVVSAVVAGGVAAQEKQNPAGNGGALTNIFKNINIRNIGETLGAKIGPVVTGNVTAINGTTITIASKLAYVPGSANSLLQATTYTVDASKATIHRINRTIMPTPRPPVGRMYPLSVNAPPQLNVNSAPLVNTPPEPTDNVNSAPLVNTPAGDLNAQMLVNYPVGTPSNTPGSARKAPQLLSLKNLETTIKVSDIHIGDLLVVRGTVTGTAIVATDITVSPSLGGTNGEKKAMVTGTVQTISGTTLTVLSSATASTQAAVTYTVDASSAVIRKYSVPSPAPAPSATGGTAVGKNIPPRRPMESTATISDIAVGDTVSVQGTVSGTNIIAIEIVDGVKLGVGQSRVNLEQTGAKLKKEVEAVKPGLWAKIESFFSGLFGKK
jgi:hypothetical protein